MGIKMKKKKQKTKQKTKNKNKTTTTTTTTNQSSQIMFLSTEINSNKKYDDRSNWRLMNLA